MKLTITKMASAMALTVISSGAHAADKYWACNTNSWNAACWSATFGGAPTASAPTASDNVFLTQSDATNRTVSYVNPAFMFLNSLTVNASGTGMMTFSQSQDYLGVAAEYIGVNGKGTFNHNGGTNSATNLTLGLNNGDIGNYSLGGTGILQVTGSASSLKIGNSGTGIFTQSSGTNTANNLVLGVNAGGSGTYTLSGGTLTTTGVTIGYLGAGSFTQSSGTHTVNGSLNLGSAGTYTQSGGTLTTTTEAIAGIFTQSGGTHTVNSSVTLGAGGGANYTQSGGTHTIKGTLIFGSAGTGIYTLNGGTLNVDSFAGSNTGTSVLNYNGGILNLTGATSNAVGTFNIGNAVGSNASLTLTNQGLTVGSLTLGNVGGTGRGTVIQNGATNSVGALTINNSSSYTLAGGTLTTTASLINHGVLTMKGGGTLSSNGTFTQGASGSFSGNGIVNSVINNAGTINAKSGNLTFSGSSFTNTGLVKNSVGSNLFVESASVSNQGNIEVNASGAVVFDSAIANKAGKNVTLLGGTLATPILTNEAGGNVKGFGALTGNLTNAGSVEFYGPTNIVGEVLNQSGGTILVRNNQTLVTGHTVNDGTIQTLKGTVIFEGGLTNNGAYLSDPSDNYFTTLNVSGTGYLVGEIGDNFLISGDFVNNSLQNTLWNTSAAGLVLNGTTLQNVYLAGDDLGALTSGYGNNFAWGEFSLVAGTSLKLWDGNGDPGAALYVGLVELGGGLGQLSSIDSPYNIYYDANLLGNAYLGGQTYALNGGGSLMAAQPVPEAETYAMMLAGLGLVSMVARRRQRSI